MYQLSVLIVLITYQTNSFTSSVLNNFISVTQQVHEGSLDVQQFAPGIINQIYGHFK